MALGLMMCFTKIGGCLNLVAIKPTNALVRAGCKSITDEVAVTNVIALTVQPTVGAVVAATVD